LNIGKSLSFDLGNFLDRHRLPDSFIDVVDQYYVPVAEWLLGQINDHSPGTFVLGINGAQGAGKTTLSNFLGEYLASQYGLSVAELSIDDIYLTRAERAELAQRVHPLLATRGVPGTHDVELGKTVIEKLRALDNGETMALPRFDKALDDRRAISGWPAVKGPLDLIIFEGWCVGSIAVSDEQLGEPLNRLEAEEDREHVWRRYVNEQLRAGYRELFAKIDALVFLEAPSFGAIYDWRLEQERKLADSDGTDGKHVMDEAGLAGFIQHYERITRHNLATLPSRADVVLSLGEDHAVTRMRGSKA
jgi:D-glycerate 3-kinase